MKFNIYLKKILARYKLLVFLCIPYFGLAQVPQMPMSPEVSTLAAFSQVQIGNFTGTANINVPFPELKGRSLSVPISLSYISSGVKLAEMSPWTGINWALQAGGCITQIIRDADDYMRITKPIIERSQFPTDPYLLEGRMLINSEDDEADVFTYSFCGRSGKMFLDGSLNAQTIPSSPLKISALVGNNIVPVTITDEQGVKYVFGKRVYDYNYFKRPNEVISVSHYLTEVIAADLSDTLKFEYDETELSFNSRVYETDFSYAESEPGELESLYSRTIEKVPGYILPNKKKFVYIKKITSSLGYVKFIQADRGIDEEVGSGLKKLSAIEYYDYRDKLISKYQFTYDGVNRMFLKRIATLGGNGLEESDFKFEYNDYSNLPSRINHGFKMDAWGYYNNNTVGHPIPDVANYFPLSASANRFPDFTKTLAGSLKKITYPTKGFTVFSYELNRSNVAVVLNRNLPSTNFVGGLRVSKIEDFDGITSKPFNVKKIEYSDGDLSYYPIFYSYFQSNRLRNPNCYQCFGNYIPIRDVIRFSGTTQSYACSIYGSDITYKHVKVINGENGEFGYSIFDYSPVRVPPNRYPSDIYSYTAGNLLKQADYNAMGVKVRETINGYTLQSIKKQISHKIDYQREIWSYNSQDHIQFKNELLPDPHTSAVTTFDIDTYYLETGWNYKNSDTVRVFDVNNSSKFSETITNYGYNNETHKQLNTISTKNSIGQEIVKQFVYPNDGNSIWSINELVNAHKIAVPIRTFTSRKDQAGALHHLSGERIYFENLKPVLFTIETPIGAQDYSPSEVATYDDYRIKYDAFSNPNEVMGRDSLTTSFYWAYHNSKMVLKVSFIPQIILKQVIGDVVNTIVGYSAGINDFERFINYVSDLDTPDKIAKWKEFNTKIRNHASLAGTHIESYTHIPLIGITSKTDSKNSTIYYQYDGFGKLSTTRDNELNILSINRYHYAN